MFWAGADALTVFSSTSCGCRRGMAAAVILSVWLVPPISGKFSGIMLSAAHASRLRKTLSVLCAI